MVGKLGEHLHGTAVIARLAAAAVQIEELVFVVGVVVVVHRPRASFELLEPVDLGESLLPAVLDMFGDNGPALCTMFSIDATLEVWT